MRTSLIAVAAVATVTLAGCGDGEDAADRVPASPSSSSVSPTKSPSESPASSPSPQAEKGPREVITIQGDTITPNAKRVDVDAGDRLTLSVTSDRAGELHVHSSPEQEVPFDRGSSVLRLSFISPGIVEVEDHESDTVILRVYVS